MNKQNLKQFADQHGGPVLFLRRHFQSRKAAGILPVGDMLSAESLLALRLARTLDDQQQGLSFQGHQNAFKQGQKFVEIGLIVDEIHSGWDLRNSQGAESTAEGISQDPCHRPDCYRRHGISYPEYRPQMNTLKALEKYGEFAVHYFLASMIATDLWVEPVESVIGRLMAAVEAHKKDRRAGFQIWDLNFEQMVVLWQMLIAGQPVHEIEYDSAKAFDPQYGAGILICKDGKAVEVTAGLIIGSCAKPKKVAK